MPNSQKLGGNLSFRASPLETGVPHQPNRIAIEIASAGQSAPDAVKTVLYPLAQAGIGLPMLKEHQTPARLQNAVNFSERLLKLRDGAQRIANHGRGGQTIGEWHALGTRLKTFHGELHGTALSAWRARAWSHPDQPRRAASPWQDRSMAR